MKKYILPFLPLLAIIVGVVAAFGTGGADEPTEPVVLGEEDLMEQVEIWRNQYRRMTPGDGPLVQDVGELPAAWEEFGNRWSSAPAERDLATWLVPFSAERQGDTTVIRDADGAVLWSGTTDFVMPGSTNVTITGALVDEADWPFYDASRWEVFRRLSASQPRLRDGEGGGTNGNSTNNPGNMFVSAYSVFTNGVPEFHVGLQWTNDVTLDIFAFGPLHEAVTNEVTYTNDENQVITTNVTHWNSVEPGLLGWANDWTWAGTVSLTNGEETVFVDTNYVQGRWKVRFYAAAEAVDTDGDGLNDGFEMFVYHTDLSVADSDGDGIGDGAEVAMGSDPADARDSPMVTINAVLYDPADANDAGKEWVELYSAKSGAVDLSGFRLEVGQSGGWSNAVVFGAGTGINPGRCLLVGESQVTNAGVTANSLAIPNPGRTDWPTGVRLVWGGATNGAVVDTVMLGGNTNFNLDITGWMSPTSIWTYAGKTAVRIHPGWDTDRAEDWTWATNRPGQNSGIELDTDNDGLPDGVEWTGSANTNATCFGEPTNPWNADSDGDGLSDYAECVVHGTNPNAWASDGDIWPWTMPGTAVSNWPGSDPFELANGWDPLVADQNTNGIPDSREMAMVATNIPSAPGAAFWLPGVDSDGDGVDNLSEMGQNSNPVDATDSTPHDYTSHFESSCPGWTNGRVDNDIGFRGWVKQVFDSVAPGSCIGVKVTEGYVLEEFELEWGGAEPLAGFEGATAQIQYTSAIVGANAWLRVRDSGLHPNVGSKQGGEYAIVVYSGKLVPDADRDGAIDESDAAAVGPDRPFRFWINDDNDEGSFSPGTNDAPGNSSPDWGDSSVGGPCDLEDFTPVWLDVHDFLLDYPGATFILKHPGGAVNAVYTDLAKEDAGGFLDSDASVFGPAFNQAAEEAGVFPVTASGVELPQAFLDKIRLNRSKGVLLLEGCTAVTAPLQLEIRLGAWTFLVHSLPLNLSSVEDMYRWVNLRGICNGDVESPTDTSEPSNWPDAESNGKHFVFVHGYNVNEPGARAWAAEMFKRLWQCGSRAMFTAVTWRGDHSQLAGVTPDYYINVVHAFDSAAMFSSYLGTALPGELFVGAHSLGNMLVSSAIVDQDLEISRFFMFNAAIPLEAYDSSMPPNLLLRPSDWANYSSNLWACYWCDLFPEGDGRYELTWRGRFESITNAVNFYSPMEDVLANATGNLPPGTTGAWVGQEMRKGRTYPESFFGNAEGGWELSSYHNPIIGFVPDTTIPIHSPMPPAQANIIPPETLKIHPFFEEFDETGLLGDNGSALAQMSSVWHQLLADAIPALSNPAGSNPIESWPDSRNVNMYRERTEHAVGIRGGSSPSEHSAIKALPLGQTKPIFEQVVENGGLNEMD